jgi:hypothetical protein
VRKYGFQREKLSLRETLACAYMRRHQAFALPPVKHGCRPAQPYSGGDGGENIRLGVQHTHIVLVVGHKVHDGAHCRRSLGSYTRPFLGSTQTLFVAYAGHLQ